MSEKDGGPAYPHCYEESGHPRWRESQGMSLRDYFAGQALAGLTSPMMFRSATADVQAAYERNAAAMAYRIADALLKARTQGDS